MCTKKVRQRCWRCKRRLVIDFLEAVKRKGLIRYQCKDYMNCSFGVHINVKKREEVGHLIAS